MSEALAHHRGLEEPVRAPARDPGSFRDPCGFVFRSEGVLYRQINVRGRDDYERLMSSGLADKLIRQGLLVPHEEAAVPFALPAIGYKVIRPESIPFISYPYEWSFGQLRDAALLTLRVQKRAIDAGLSLKDASAFNVQFLRGKPVLIDTLSFEPFVEGQPWVGYRQFCQHFLAPLALMAYGEIQLGQLSRIFLDGVPLDVASALLPWQTRLRPGLGLHVHLHARMQRLHADAAGTAAGVASGKGMNRRSLVALLENLASAVRRLTWKPAGTEWADYYAGTNYTASALDAKGRLLGGVLDELKPATVWDLGANTGRFSRLASDRGAFTVVRLHLSDPNLSVVLPLLLASLAWLAVEVLFRGRTVDQAAARLVAPWYVGMPLGMLAAVQSLGGPRATLLLVATIVVSDSGQYYTGRAFGRQPLAPAISPKKTVEGAVGGLVLATSFMTLAGPWVFPSAGRLSLALLGAAIVVLGVGGDLFESRLKRTAGVKDSSALIPGHGGVLDRIDALLFAVPAYYLYLRA